MVSKALTTVVEKVPDIKVLQRLQKRELAANNRQSAWHLAEKVLTHPVYSLVIGFAVIEGLESQQMMGNIAATALEAGLLTTALLNTLSDAGILQALLVPLLAK